MQDQRLQRLEDRIQELKVKRSAIILAHNYQLGEVQDIADHRGDSLELSRIAARSDAGVVVFCGVHFMAETAAILSPDKTVLMPEREAGCPMADMLIGDQLAELRGQHPGAVVVCYVNSSAEVKALSDICCTSANAVKVVEQVPGDKEIIFVPDQYLGGYAGRVTGRPMILWPGFCPTHARILPQHLERKRREYPDAVIMVHPECRPEVVDLADQALGTGGMCKFARSSDAATFVVGTEVGLIHRLAQENPEKTFVPVTEQAICPNMKLHTLESIAESLERMEPRVTVPEEVRIKAERAVQRMLEIG